MTAFSEQDIADYYDQTRVHFTYFWKLKQARALHYGIWKTETRSFTDALNNTSDLAFYLADVKRDQPLLDAGCGVGGSSIRAALTIGCEVEGISLSHRQVAEANKLAAELGVNSSAHFSRQSYLNTTFANDHFGSAIAIESMSSTDDTAMFLKEMFRILRPGSKLCVLDFFKQEGADAHSAPHLYTYLNCWAISDVETRSSFEQLLVGHGFIDVQVLSLNSEIRRSAWRMYVGGWLGRVGSWMYGIFRKTSPFARLHYKSGISQWKSLQKGEWSYLAISARKPEVERG
jgi:tocopherol O-methyltransferase